MTKTYFQFLPSLTDDQRAEWESAGQIWDEKYEPYMYVCCACQARVDRRDSHPCNCECEGNDR